MKPYEKMKKKTELTHCVMSIRISRGSAIKGLNPILSLSIVVECWLPDGEEFGVVIVAVAVADVVVVVVTFFLRSLVEERISISSSSLIMS